MRNRLIAAAALSPLIAVAAGSWACAETVITGNPPFSTSKSNDDLKNASGTTLTATATAPVVITLDSDKSVNNSGVITATDIDNSQGILVVGGHTGSVTNAGAITIGDSYTRTDTDGDGDLDGPFAKGATRYGIHVDAGGTFTGNGAALTTGGSQVAILNALTGSITAEGSTSYGILVESNVIGSVDSLGAVTVNGDNSGGIAIKGNVSGDVRAGAVTVRGLASTGVTIDGDVGGKIDVSGGVTTSGYSFQARPAATQLTVLDSDDTGQNSVAMRIAGSVGGGLLISVPPTASTTVTDVDGDGVPDASQGSGAIASYGSAPALFIGSTTHDITLGNVGTTADTAYGVVNQGQIVADGVFDKATSNALVIGGAGKSANLTGGLNNSTAASLIQSNAYQANSTAITIADGGVVGTINNAGTIGAQVTTSNATDQARAIDVTTAGNLGSIVNSGSIRAGITGLTGITIAINDGSGLLQSITNTGVISAGIVPPTGVTGAVNGTTIALIDVNNTKGLAITQSQSAVTGAAGPSIIGDLFFGSGADSLTVSAGIVTGTISFGAGADSLNISGDTTSVVGALLDDGAGGLAVKVDSGRLSVLNAQEIKGSSLSLGAKAALLISADPTKTTTDTKNTIAVTHFEVADATLTAGAQIGLTLQGVLLNPTKLTVISGSNSLTSTGALGTTLLQNAPFLYQVTSSVDTTAREVYLNVQRRSTTDLGFNRSETAAYDAVFSALTADTGIQSALLSQTSKAGLQSVYDQLLPDQGQGVFSTLDSALTGVSRLIDDRPDPEVRVGGDSLWLQEVNQRVHRDTVTSLGDNGQLIGLVGGYESMSTRAGGLGFTGAYYNIQDSDSASAVGEHVVASLVEGGVYYRLTPGPFRFSVRAAGGYAWLNSTRRFVYPGVVRQAEANWTATFFDAHAGAAYEARFGRYFARPELNVDWLYLSEGSQTESGGGTGFDLAINARKSDRMTASAMLTFGMQYGRTQWLRPEFTVGYRQVASGTVGATVARFVGAGSPFTLLADEDSGGWLVAGFSIKGGTEVSYVAMEGDAELRDGEQRYNIRLAGRAMF